MLSFGKTKKTELILSLYKNKHLTTNLFFCSLSRSPNRGHYFFLKKIISQKYKPHPKTST